MVRSTLTRLSLPFTWPLHADGSRLSGSSSRREGPCWSSRTAKARYVFAGCRFDTLSDVFRDRIRLFFHSQTALHKAALQAHIPVLSYLLVDRNMSPFGPDREGFTALHGASSRGHAEVVGVLLEHGAGGYDPEEALGDGRQRALDRQAKAGWTPLSQCQTGSSLSDLRPMGLISLHLS